MFVKDNRTETFLTQMGASFKYSNSIDMSDFMPGWKSHNLARPTPVRDDAVLEYATLMDNGSQAPAPIIVDTKGGYDVLDGIQRLVAAELKDATKVSAYLVESDSDDLLMSIRVLANARLQGRPEPPEWTKRRAVEILVIQRKLSVQEVAQMGGWKPSEVKSLARLLDWSACLRSIDAPNVADNLVDVIANNTTQEELRSAAVPISSFLKTLKNARIPCSESGPLVEEFFKPIAKASKKHDTYEQRHKEIAERPDIQIALHGRKSPGLPKHVALQRSLKAAETIAKDIAQNSSELPAPDEFFRLLGSIEKQIRRVAKRPKAASFHTPSDMWGSK